MKELIKKNKIIILVVILILIGIGIGAWQYQHQKAVNLCKKQCRYGATTVSAGLRETKTIEGWLYGYRWEERVFSTQEQCIDYCLAVK